MERHLWWKLFEKRVAAEKRFEGWVGGECRLTRTITYIIIVPSSQHNLCCSYVTFIFLLFTSFLQVHFQYLTLDSTDTTVFRSRHYQTSIIKVYLDWVIEIALIEMQINCALLHQSRLSVRSCTRCWRLDAFIHTPSSSPSPGLPDLETAFLHCQLLSGIVRVSSFSTTIHLLSSHFSYSYHCSYL